MCFALQVILKRKQKSFHGDDEARLPTDGGRLSRHPTVMDDMNAVNVKAETSLQQLSKVRETPHTLTQFKAP